MDKMFKYGKEITWSVPVLFQYEPVWMAIYKVFQEYGLDIPFVNAYGSPALAWTGGKCPAVSGEFDSNTLLKIYEYILSAKAIPTLIFTYSKITKDDLNDRYANYFLDVALEVGAQFVVCSDLLKNYIREKKSDAYIISSLLKPIFEFQGKDKKQIPTIENETNYYNKLLKEYDRVVVRGEYSKNVLTKTPELIDDISRIEVLINSSCIPDCPQAPSHYTFLESMRKTGGDPFFECVKFKNLNDNTCFKNTLFHSEETTKKLVDNGIKFLKIEGRCSNDIAQSLALQIFGRMFRQSGSNYLLIEELIHGAVDAEVMAFKKMLGIE